MSQTPAPYFSVPRSFLCYILLLGVFLGLLGRLVYFSTLGRSSFLKGDETVRLYQDILDDRGSLLATSLPTFSVYAHPHEVVFPKRTAWALHSIFPSLSFQKIYRSLVGPKKFVWIARHISPEQKWHLSREGLRGVECVADAKRFYPHGPVFSHVVGFSDGDQNGLSGLEYFQRDWLQSTEKGPLKTTLNSSLQHILYRNLMEKVRHCKGKGGWGMLVELKTGKIKAMVSLPDFDPNHVQEMEVVQPGGMDEGGTVHPLFNRILSGVYEFGSVLKIHNVAAALENNISLTRSYDARFPLKLGKFTIKDFRGKNKWLTLEEGFAFSSNIVNSKAALEVGPKRIKNFWEKLDIKKPMDLGFGESARALLPKKWSESFVATLGYGYGVALTPLHLTQSIASLLSERPCSLHVLEGNSSFRQPFLSKAHVQKLTRAMAKAVQEGTVRKAKVPGLHLGGKSGTANCRVRGRYKSNLNIVTCAITFPVNDPHYLLMLSIDRPQASQETHGYATAGWIVVPLASVIIPKMLPFLGYNALGDSSYKEPLKKPLPKNFIKKSL